MKRTDSYYAAHIHVFSDLHYGKLITYNESLDTEYYDTEVAEQRFREAVKEMIRRSLEQNTKHIYVLFLGDMVDGDIHKDALAVQGGIASIRDEVFQLFKSILRVYENIQDKYNVPIEVHVVVGNHGRYSKKPYTKTAIYNFEYELFDSLKNYFYGKFAKFNVYDQHEALFPFIFAPEKRILIAHKYAGRSYYGVPWTSLVNVLHKKLLAFSNEKQEIIGAIIGHWHTPGMYYINQRGHFLVINGAFYTVDAYTRNKGLTNPPIQMLLGARYYYQGELAGKLEWTCEPVILG